MPRGRKRKIAFVPQPWIGNSSSEDEQVYPVPQRPGHYRAEIVGIGRGAGLDRGARVVHGAGVGRGVGRGAGVGRGVGRGAGVALPHGKFI